MHVKPIIVGSTMTIYVPVHACVASLLDCTVTK